MRIYAGSISSYGMNNVIVELHAAMRDITMIPPGSKSYSSSAIYVVNGIIIEIAI